MTKEILESIRREGAVVDADGVRHPLRLEIDPHEERFIRDLIRSDPAIRRTLEVGLAYGISALTICGATQGRERAYHIAFDPYQTRLFHGVGIENLKRAGIEFAEVIEDRSELAMPRLLADGVEPFDLVFIDGLHTFDQTLIDLYFGLRLLRVGGYIVIDDCRMRGVQRAVSYLTNYPFLSMVGQVRQAHPFRRLRHSLGAMWWGTLPKPVLRWLPKQVYDALDRSRWTSMVALRKDAEDARPLDWFQPF
jgi:predicted O-methyltransferase YrrM